MTYGEISDGLDQKVIFLYHTGIPMYEIDKMVEAGMTPMQIIVASTMNAAVVSGKEMEIGTLQAGKIADILVVNGNPLDDIQALTQISLVVHLGEIIRNEGMVETVSFTQ